MEKMRMVKVPVKGIMFAETVEVGGVMAIAPEIGAEMFEIDSAMKSAIPVALMMAPNEPPAPVMRSTMPQLFRASVADLSISSLVIVAELMA